MTDITNTEYLNMALCGILILFYYAQNKECSMKCLIIIPAYNESDNIVQVLTDIKNKCPDVDYLVVDDCSSDMTKQKLQEVEASYISATVNLGIGGAVQAGYRYALANDYDVAIQVDGDGQHDVAYIQTMITLLEEKKADIVIGSRFIDKEGFQSSGMRRAGINFLSGLIFLLCGKKIRDVTSGFRAVNKRFIKIYANDYPDDYPEPEAIVTALINGGNILEIPVVMQERISGRSSINFKRSVYYMIKVTLAIIICRISLGFRRE